MRYVTLSVALSLFLAFGGSAHAQGSVTFAGGSPSTGVNAGEINVSGTVNLDAGWKLADTIIVIRTWQDGKVLTNTTFTSAAVGDPKVAVMASWPAVTVKGLSSGATYNVTVEMQVADIATGFKKAQVLSVPGSAAAK